MDRHQGASRSFEKQSRHPFVYPEQAGHAGSKIGPVAMGRESFFFRTSIYQQQITGLAPQQLPKHVFSRGLGHG